MHWLISPYATDPSVTTELQPWFNAIDMATSASGLDDATNNSVNTVLDQKYCIFVLLLLLGERLFWARPVSIFQEICPHRRAFDKKICPHRRAFDIYFSKKSAHLGPSDTYGLQFSQISWRNVSIPSSYLAHLGPSDATRGDVMTSDFQKFPGEICPRTSSYYLAHLGPLDATRGDLMLPEVILPEVIQFSEISGGAYAQ